MKALITDLAKVDDTKSTSINQLKLRDPLDQYLERVDNEGDKEDNKMDDRFLVTFDGQGFKLVSSLGMNVTVDV